MSPGGISQSKENQTIPALSARSNEFRRKNLALKDFLLQRLFDLIDSLPSHLHRLLEYTSGVVLFFFSLGTY